VNSQAYEWSSEKIVIFCDNKNVSIILKKGSRKIYLHSIAIELHLICHQMDINLTSIWMSRDDPRISQADALSRFFDLSDWGTCEEEFAALQLCTPKFEVDLFGADTNAKCLIFFSETPSANTSGVNAFSKDWSKFGYGYACPPIKLISAAIRHIMLCGAKGTLAVPLWAASAHWLSMCPDGRHFSSLFSRALIGRPRMQSGIHVKSQMFKERMKSDFVYLEYNGEVELPLFPVLRADMCTLRGCNKCQK
jgi:hypothetical protein